MGVEFLTINVLLHTNSEQKVIGNEICTQIIFKNSLKTGFSIRNILLQFGCNSIFLIRKTDF